MSGGQDGDVGRAYLETQHAMGQIRGRKLPILVLLTPSPPLPSASASFRLLPPAPAIFPQIPFLVASGPYVCWQHVWGQEDDVGRLYPETQLALGHISG